MIRGRQAAGARTFEIEAEGIEQVKLIDATPIGINVRSTVATYADVHDELRKVYARTRRCQGKEAARPVIFPTIRAACAARYATARG